MSFINTNSLRLYGGNPSGDIQVQQGAGPTNAGVPEILVPATYRRAFMGPKGSGHSSIQIFVDSAGGATSAMTVWYSNHPNPSIANDADWTQDTNIGTAADLTVTGNKLVIIGNVFIEWIMLKAIVATSNASVRAFVRTEGTTIGHMG